MGVKLVSSGGGSVEINPPATASSFTATMPAGTGTVAVNGVSGTLVSGTAVASTSGTSIDFTGIPSWVKRITVMFNGVSTNGASHYLVQVGSGSITSSGYSGVFGTTQFTAGFGVASGNAANVWFGQMAICLISSNSYVAASSFGNIAGGTQQNGGGASPNLSGPLDRVRITTANGTDTFDAGSINILYE